jgi:translation elongation factor P/translation initiation factor 5A
MVKKKAEDLKKSDKILMGSEHLVVESVEISDVGKQGIKKCRIVAKRGQENIVIVRPSDYPFTVVD